MKLRRTIPPAAAPIGWGDLWHGLAGIFAGGRSIKRLEGEIKDYFGVRHVFLVSSGKAALAVILLGLKDLSPRREVIIPAYTCYSVPSAVLKAGLEPALCDIDAATFDFEIEGLKRTVNDDTLCVVPCHLFGVPADVDRVKDVCRIRGVYVVEDAAQAMGGMRQGRKLGTIGDVGFFSLGRGKNITCGSGGIIVTNSDEIAGAIHRHYNGLRTPGIGETLGAWMQLAMMALFIRPALYWFPAGLPFLKLGETFFHRDFPIQRLSGMKAALLRNWRRNLEASNQIRSESAAWMQSHLPVGLRSDPGVPYLRLPILCESQRVRDRLLMTSRSLELGLSLMYPGSINEIDEIRDRFGGKSFPSAKGMAERLLTVPTHSLVSRGDQEKIRQLFERTRSEAAALGPEARSTAGRTVG
jgi:dTDP-4-amino-4,6-dideoxygalactose transaminase